MTTYAMTKQEAQITLDKVTGNDGRVRLGRQFQRDSVGMIEFVYGSAIGWSIFPIEGPNKENGSYVYKLAKEKVKIAREVLKQ